MSLKQQLLKIPMVRALNEWRHERFSPPEYQAEVVVVPPFPLPDPRKEGDLVVEVRVLNTGRLPWVPGGGVKLRVEVGYGKVVEEHVRVLGEADAAVEPGGEWKLDPFPIKRWRRSPGYTILAEVSFPPSRSIGVLAWGQLSVHAQIEGPAVELDHWNAFMERQARAAAARGEVVEFPLRIMNIGTEVIGGDDDYVSWHLYDAGLELVHWDGPRIPINREVTPGATRNMLVRIDPALLPAKGEFVLRFDVVRENTWWAVNLPVPADLAIRFNWEGHQESLPHRPPPNPPEPARDPSDLSFPKDLPIETEVIEIDAEEFARFEQWVQPWIDQRERVLAPLPGVETWGVINPTREKLLEYYLSTLVLRPRAGWTLLDVASCTSLFPNIYAQTCNPGFVIRQDLLYEDGSCTMLFPTPELEHFAWCDKDEWKESSESDSYPKDVAITCIGSDACAIPQRDESVDAITLHCSLEHFEGDADSRFVREAMRILRPGGQLLVIPFYCGGESAELYHPEYAPGCRFHRYYTPETFRRRVLDAIPCAWSARLYQFPNARKIDPAFYCDLAMVIQKR